MKYLKYIPLLAVPLGIFFILFLGNMACAFLPTNDFGCALISHSFIIIPLSIILGIIGLIGSESLKESRGKTSGMIQRFSIILLALAIIAFIAVTFFSGLYIYLISII